MLPLFWEGFGTGSSLIIAIGAQNAFVLAQGVKREHHLPVALVCAVCDALLIAAGLAGMGAALAAAPALKQGAALAGALFLGLYGLRAARSAWRGGEALCAGTEENGETCGRSLGTVLALTLAVTLLNPHVYLDTVLLLGSIGGRHGDPGRWHFGAGAALASFLWFFGLALLGRLLAPLLARPAAWRALDGLVALVMWSVGAGLVHFAFAA